MDLGVRLRGSELEDNLTPAIGISGKRSAMLPPPRDCMGDDSQAPLVPLRTGKDG